VVLVSLALWISETGCVCIAKAARKEKRRSEEGQEQRKGGITGAGDPGILTENPAFSWWREKYDEVEREEIGSGYRRRRGSWSWVLAAALDSLGRSSASCPI
jgi:hypothetical protein